VLIATETLYQLSYTPGTFSRARVYHVNPEFHPNCEPTRFGPLMIFGESTSVQKSHSLRYQNWPTSQLNPFRLRRKKLFTSACSSAFCFPVTLQRARVFRFPQCQMMTARTAAAQLAMQLHPGSSPPPVMFL